MVLHGFTTKSDDVCWCLIGICCRCTVGILVGWLARSDPEGALDFGKTSTLGAKLSSFQEGASAPSPSSLFRFSAPWRSVYFISIFFCLLLQFCGLSLSSSRANRWKPRQKKTSTLTSSTIDLGPHKSTSLDMPSGNLMENSWKFPINRGFNGKVIYKWWIYIYIYGFQVPRLTSLMTGGAIADSRTPVAVSKLLGSLVIRWFIYQIRMNHQPFTIIYHMNPYIYISICVTGVTQFTGSPRPDHLLGLKENSQCMIPITQFQKILPEIINC